MAPTFAENNETIEDGIPATRIPSEDTPFIIGLLSDHISNSSNSKSNSKSNSSTINKGNNEAHTKTKTKNYILFSFCRNNGCFILFVLVLLLLWCWPSKVEDAASVKEGGVEVEVEFEFVDEAKTVLNNSSTDNNNSNGIICICYNCKGSAGCCKCDEHTCPFGGRINRFDSSCRGRFVLF